ncbi:MAG: DNA polymerase IV [Treponema sp.]|nr:DNA polymerase IV [Treponema sp.]
MENVPRWYLHVDLDAFFASVEQLDNPEFRGKPVIVGGKPEDRRSVVSTASYEARAFGVHSAMPVFQAYKLCPNGIFVHGRMHRYAELSYQIMNIFRDFSPDVDQMSIDEAFIDLTGTEKLFGPPEITAQKIKERVKNETGLTVSIGLASTKYLAKIASGLNKPDGFCHIKKGQEQNFMLNLPLKKVWGLGPKSLELIRTKGFRTTRDIFEQEYETLEFLFGKNMASFLYNVVRGTETASFSRETKSHSISAETTFPYDLTDIYTIETELLELCHGVFFRLLKEEGFSRTAMVKIRYEDFSTCTVQETVERNIITIDTFYEIIKRLFEKRYENGRGIRLLGVGFENIVKDEKPYQQDLFDNGDEKKQAVEKAILKLSKKHPEIKVRKARTLKAVLFAFLISGALINPQKAAANSPEPFDLQKNSSEKAQITEREKESASSLFNYDINDNNFVDFSISGFWKAQFESGINFSFGNDTQSAASAIIPVFKQEAQLSALLSLNNHWYFQADFEDTFTKNTFAFGYKGENLVRDFRIANRNITMSQGYSAEQFGFALRGGENQAPGISLLLKPQSERWQADFLVRYDMTETKRAVYYGMNKVSDSDISPENFVYGREFHFPQNSLNMLYKIENVFVEDNNGSFRDGRGKKYKRLSADLFWVNENQNRLYLSKEAGGAKDYDGKIPAILITFFDNSAPQQIENDLGNYDNENSFLGEIKKELGDEVSKTENNYQKITTIDGQNALIIQDSKGFSPFLCQNIYDSGKKSKADVFVVSQKSEITVAKYQANSDSQNQTLTFEDFFENQNNYIKIINKEQKNSVYPFAKDCPEIYFGKKQNGELAIRTRNYAPVKEIQISKKAAGDTVQAYKNGTLINAATFDEKTGVVTLNEAVSPTDRIEIIWQEETSDFEKGAIAAGAGFKYHFLPGFFADVSLTTKIPIKQKDYSATSQEIKSSFTALSGGLNFEKGGLELSQKSTIALQNENTSDILILYDWQNELEDYEEELEEYSNAIVKPAIPQKPEKKSEIHFLPADFSNYKTISIELDFEQFTTETQNQSLQIIIDEDSGTKDSNNYALKLFISDCRNFAQNKGIQKIKIIPAEKKVFAAENELLQNDFDLQIFENVKPSRLIVKTEENANQENKVFVQKFSYENAQFYFTAQNYLIAKYKKQGPILKIKNFELFKDFSISAESNQGSGNFTNPKPFINSKAKTEFTFVNISFASDLSLNQAEIAQAGHSVKTKELLFGILFAQDDYRFNPVYNELKKQNEFYFDFSKIKIPVKISLKTAAFDSLYDSKQSGELTFNWIQDFKILETEIGAKTIAAQKSYSGKNTKNLQSLNNYFSSWYDISQYEFSNGQEDAKTRENLYSGFISISFPKIKNSVSFSPKITYELSDKYETNDQTENQALFTDKEYLKLQLPFSTEKRYFSFDISRTAGALENCKRGGSYTWDTEKLFNKQYQRKWFYTQLPFYELFDTKAAQKIDETYESKYEINYRRKLSNSMKDLYIPSSINFAVSRSIKSKTQEESSQALDAADLYQIKTLITTNSINNFGANSRNKIFNWFQTEELTTSLSAAAKIPSDSPGDFRLKIQSFAQLLIFVKEKTIISQIFDFNFENNYDWNLRNIISYTRPSTNSLLSALIYFVYPDLINQNNSSVSRKDQFTFEIGQISNNFRQKYDYQHSVGIDFMEYFNVNAGIGGTLILNQNSTDNFSLNFTIGAKAEF